MPPQSRGPRTLQDLPWQGNAVRFLLTVPKFFCDNTDCPRKVFAERIDRSPSATGARRRASMTCCSD